MALIEEDERPSQLAILTQALPVLADYLKANEARREVQITELSAAITAEISTAKEQLAGAFQSSLQAFLAESVFQLKSASIPTPALAPAPAPSPAQVPVSIPRVSLLSASRSISPQSGAQSRAQSGAESGVESEVAPGAASGAVVEGEVEGEPQRYRMSRAVKTVRDLWREWTIGLQGGPSIVALDNRWGSRWRAGRQAEVQWYSLRLEVIREIRRVARARRISEESAMYFVGAEQRHSNCSLDLYCKRLRANRKTREAPPSA